MTTEEKAYNRAVEQVSMQYEFGPNCVSVDWIRPHVARVEYKSTTVAVKFCQSTRVAQQETSMLVFLSEKGCSDRVQELLVNREGLGLTDSDLGPAMVTRWMHGQQKYYRDIDDTEWRALGQLLAQLHGALQDYPGESLPRLENILLDVEVEQRIKSIICDREKLAQSGASSAVLHLQDSRMQLLKQHHGDSVRGHSFGSAQAIHNDFNANNYIFFPQEVPRILDWDRALYAPAAYEVVRCLNHLPLESPGRAKAFLQGYLACRPLDSNALLWAVHAAMISHAIKDWPVELALAGQPGSMQGLEKLAPMVSRFVSEGEALLRFFETCGKESR